MVFSMALVMIFMHACSEDTYLTPFEKWLKIFFFLSFAERQRKSQSIPIYESQIQSVPSLFSRPRRIIRRPLCERRYLRLDRCHRLKLYDR
jgi:hypothetical protein